MPGSLLRFVAFLGSLVFCLVVARRAAADTLQAPVGGKTFSLGDRVVCGGAPPGWTVERDGHALRPPAGDEALGRSAEIRLAPASVGCSAASRVTLVATGRPPAVDASSFVVAVDDARAELRGKRLKGLRLAWRFGDVRGDDTCLDPRVEGAVEICTFGLGRGIPADPAATFRWLPPAGSVDEDASTFDENGRLLSAADRSLRPARVVVSRLFAPGASLDVSKGTSEMDLLHPEAATSVECPPAVCEIVDGKLVARGVTQTAASLRVHFRLVPRVVLAKNDALDASPLVDVPVLRCPMTITSGQPLRDVDDARAIVKIEGRCRDDVRSLRFFSGSRNAEPVAYDVEKDAAYVLLSLGLLQEEVSIRAVRGEGEGTLVAVARSATRRVPPISAALELEDGQPIDFIPTNRAAVIRVPPPAEGIEVGVLPVEGVYDVARDGAVEKVRGTAAAVGYVSLRYALRVKGPPGPLRTAVVAVVRDAVQRPVHEAHVAAPLAGVVDLRCVDTKGRVHVVKPGQATRIAFENRDGCYVSLARDRIPAELGAQKLVLDVDVTRVDGMPRPASHVSEPTVLRPGKGSRIAWIKGVDAPFDRVTVRVSHAQDEQFYAVKSEQPLTPPASQWSLVMSQAIARMYLTATIPTVLYRVSNTENSGILSLNFGVLGRLTWVDIEGRDGILALEAGVIGVGLAPVDASTKAQNLRQVASVIGLGLGMPIANRALPTQASINLHAWFEYEISRAIGPSEGSPYAFVFGPSITFGNVGTYL